MSDWKPLLILIGLVAFMTFWLGHSVLLVVRTEWTIQQRWSPFNQEHFRRNHEWFPFLGMDPDYASMRFYRFLGIVFLAFPIAFALGAFGGRVGNVVWGMFGALFFLYCIFNALAWAILPLSILRRIPLMTEGMPPSGQGMWYRRIMGALVLTILGVSIYGDLPPPCTSSRYPSSYLAP